MNQSGFADTIRALDGLRSHARAGAHPRHRAHVRAGARPTRRRGARPRIALPVRARLGARGARAHGASHPGGVRRRRRGHGLLRDRDRGADPRRLVRRDHGRRAHVSRHDADPPLRERGAEAALAAGARGRHEARRLRADRAGGGLGCGEHANDGRTPRRLLGDQRLQALHHQRRNRHHVGRDDHRPHRRRRDLEHRRRERNRGLHDLRRR